MAQRYYDLNLQDTDFPMLSEDLSKTTIIAADGESPDQPKVAYCHNVMPTREGMVSISYRTLVQANSALPLGLDITDARIIFGNDKTRFYLSWDFLGNVYVLEQGTDEWIAVPTTVPDTTGVTFNAEDVTIATVNGVSYIYYSKVGAFVFNETTKVLDPAPFTGIDEAVILGVVANAGYLIAYTTEAIAWSSTIDPTDFVPSQITGAGGGNVAGIAGDILFSTPHPLGIMIFTVANVIVATFTGNSSYPFKFRELNNSRGGITLDLVAYEANAANQFVFSKAGLQTLSIQRAEVVLPEVTDFLAGSRFEDFDEITLEFNRSDMYSPMKKKIKLISSRYLVISYGVDNFTHALVFDIALQKLGKLKIQHADVFEFIGEQEEISKESIAFILDTGEVKIVDFATKNKSNGVLLLGKLQYTSTRMMKLLGVELENVRQSTELSVYSKAAVKGKRTINVEGALTTKEDLYREYGFLSTAKTHSLLFIGQFDLNTARVRFATAGRR